MRAYSGSPEAKNIACALIVVTTCVVAVAQVRVREDVETFAQDPAKVSALRLAFETLRDSPDKTKNLAFWQSIHGTPITVPCEHGSELIWSWHRAYLHAFETALRESHPPETSNVTLPYWDWTKRASGKRLPKLYEEQGVFLDKFRSHEDWPRPALDSAVIDKLLDTPLWPAFGSLPASQGGGKGGLERQAHDVIHGFVGDPNDPDGRNMGDAGYSALDPIFWAHHSNLDRIWLEWQKKWKTPPFDLDAEIKGLPTESVQRDWVDVSAKYSYGPKAPPPPAPPEPMGPIVAGEAVAPTRAARLFATVVQAPQPGVAFLAAESLPKIDPAEQRIVLRMQSISLPPDIGRFVRGCVYIHPVGEKVTSDAKLADRYLADSFTHWNLDADHGAHHQAGGLNFIFDVTDAVQHVVSENPNVKLAVTVQFFAADNGKATGRKYGRTAKGPEIGKITLESVKLSNGKWLPSKTWDLSIQQ